MKERIKRSLLGAALGLSCLATLSAQTARQGDARSIQPSIFQSPMILETIFAPTDRTTWGRRDWLAPLEYTALGRYTCDGVSLRRYVGPQKWDAGVLMQAHEGPSGTLEVAIRVWAWNPPHNHDKAVTLVLEIVNGPVVIASGVIGPMPTKDNGAGQYGAVRIALPITAMKTEPPPTLRITMTTKDI